MFSFITLTLVAASVLGIFFLGLFTLKKNTNSATNLLFFLFASSLSLYNVFNYFAINQTTDSTTIFWIRIVIANACVINLFLLLFAATFPKKEMGLHKSFIILASIFSLITMALSLTNLVFSGVKQGTFDPIPGPGISLFMAQTLFCIGSGSFFLIRKYVRSLGIEKNQLRLFLLASGVLFACIILTNLLFVVFLHTTTFVGLLPIYTLFFISVISYAIVKHRFLDIRIIVARSVAYLLLVVFLGVIYSLDVFSIQKLVTNESISASNLITSTILALIIAFSFQPIKKMLEGFTTRLFYKESYDTNHVLSRLSQIMAAVPELSQLTEYIFKELSSHIKMGDSHIVVIRDKRIIWAKSSTENRSQEFNEEEIISLVEFLSRSTDQKALIYEEVTNPHEKEIMGKNDITLLIPLIAERELIGAFLFGEKQSGEIFSEQDIDVLTIFAPEFAIAIRNAMYYEEIKRFNITLKEEIKRATEKLQKANERLQGLDHMKDEFISIASHELRTPMTVIKSYLWMVMNGKGGPVSEKQSFYLSRAYQSVDGLISLVNEMLDISRIESNRIILNPKELDVATYIKDLLLELDPRAQELGVTLAIGNHTTNPHIYADPDKLREVFVNLIGNSLKFTSRGGSITVSFMEKKELVEISIADTGAGIAKEDLPKLFQKFGMVEGNYLTKQTTQGTGLGLYIAKSIIELHGGHIYAVSPGKEKGTTFIFTLKIYTEGVALPHQDKQ